MIEITCTLVDQTRCDDRLSSRLLWGGPSGPPPLAGLKPRPTFGPLAGLKPRPTFAVVRGAEAPPFM